MCRFACARNRRSANREMLFERWIVWIVTFGTVHNHTLASPRVQAFTVSSAGPVFSLLEVTLGTELIGVIEADLTFVIELERVHVVAIVAGTTVHDGIGSVIELQVCVHEWTAQKHPLGALAMACRDSSNI